MDNQLEAIQEAPTGVSAADNRIATKFKFWPLIRFVLPTMAMSLFMALFKSVDDGLFVSQFVGKKALSAVNICFPLVIGVWGDCGKENRRRKTRRGAQGFFLRMYYGHAGRRGGGVALRNLYGAHHARIGGG